MCRSSASLSNTLTTYPPDGDNLGKTRASNPDTGPETEANPR